MTLAQYCLAGRSSQKVSEVQITRTLSISCFALYISRYTHQLVSFINHSPPPDAMTHHVFVYLAILAVARALAVSGNGQSEPTDICRAGRDGRDGRDGQPGPPGPPGPPGKGFVQRKTGNSSIYMLITRQDVKNEKSSNRVRLYESLSAGTSISFDAGSTTYSRLMRITLVEPDVLDNADQYVVTATIAHRNPVSPSTDMDLSITVTDDQSAVGYEIADQSNSPTYTWASEGLNKQILNPTITAYKSTWPVNYYSPLHTVQVKFGGGAKAFGILKTVSNVNTLASHQYSKTLKPSKGVYVDVYRNDPAEKYIIDFIALILEKETY